MDLRGASFHVMVIGDWGGVRYTSEMPIMPADHRSELFPKRRRSFVHGVDDYAQQRVAAQMINMSSFYAPDYVLNVGGKGYIILYYIVLYCIVLYCIALHCIALYCIVLYCIVLYCIVLYYVVQGTTSTGAV